MKECDGDQRNTFRTVEVYKIYKNKKINKITVNCPAFHEGSVYYIGDLTKLSGMDSQFERLDYKLRSVYRLSTLEFLNGKSSLIA